MLPPRAFTGDPDTSPAGAPYKKYVTLWGNDPIWASPFVPGIAPTLAHFPLARTAPDPTGAWLPPNAPAAEKRSAPGRVSRSKGCSRPSPDRSRMGTVDVAPHDVFYDADRGSSGIATSRSTAGASYFPFIRLALARYQPISSRHAHLSNVVLADIIALSADRWLNVTPAADSPKVRVAVFGVTLRRVQRPSRGRAGSLASSRIDPLTGVVEVRAAGGGLGADGGRGMARAS